MKKIVPDQPIATEKETLNWHNCTIQSHHPPKTLDVRYKTYRITRKIRSIQNRLNVV